MNEPRPKSAASPAREEARTGRGRLKVFFGLGPGIGKTDAMLRAAHEALRQRTDVVVGVVETRGRRETEALLAGLPQLPRAPQGRDGSREGDLDLEAILSRRPTLVLVDDLAHANAPGARHPRRHQDVVELLDAGISVHSTLNVQQVESRADAVRQITGAPVGETVPDSLLEQAEEIVLIDLTPEMLRDRWANSAGNSLQETHVIALRELALRLMAERVEARLREARAATAAKTAWRAGERLLVAVGPSPFSTQLVRWTRRMAAAQSAAWMAVSVESARALTAEARGRLEQNLALARELGAEVVVTHDEDVAAALVRIALQHNATQIVVGKSRSPWLLDLLRGGSLVDRLLRRGGAMDIHVVPAERAASRPGVHLEWEPPEPAPAREYLEVLGVLAVLSILSSLVSVYIGYLAVGLLYLLATIALSLRVGRWPVLLAGVISALTWNFFFIPPAFTLRIEKFEDGMMFVTYFAVALIAGQLTARIRAQERHERRREERAMALFRLTQALSAARSMDEGVFAALRQADALFEAKSALLLGGPEDGALTPHFAGSWTLTDEERAAANWAWRNRRQAGRFTDTLPAAEGFHVPLVREETALGVLVIQVAPAATLTLAQRDLIESFAAQLALLVESEASRAAVEREKLLAESDKLHRALLDGVSHELKTPLAVLRGAAESLPQADAATRQQLVGEILTATRRLHRLVNNLLDQTRLESGALKPRLDWCDAHDLVNAACAGVEDLLNTHPLEISIPEEMPLFRADFALMEQVIANLLLNAALHTPPQTPVFLTAGLDRSRQQIFFTLADRGPGLPPAMKERLFRKFQRGDAARAGGLGLGLSIIRGFVAAQGGEVVAGENPGGGAVFSVYLPYVPHPSVPSE